VKWCRSSAGPRIGQESFYQRYCGSCARKLGPQPRAGCKRPHSAPTIVIGNAVGLQENLLSWHLVQQKLFRNIYSAARRRRPLSPGAVRRSSRLLRILRSRTTNKQAWCLTVSAPVAHPEPVEDNRHVTRQNLGKKQVKKTVTLRQISGMLIPWLILYPLI
jgi:hypothetical protein